MPYFTGQVAAKNVFSTIISLITQVQQGEIAPWWVNESSLAADGAYVSTGTSGNERIVVILKDGTLGKHITVGYARNYTPGAVNIAGTFDNAQTRIMEYFTAAQNGDVLVAYDLNVTKDRIILHLQGDKLITTWCNPVVYLGMPIRYDTNDKMFNVFALSEGAQTANVCYVVEDAIKSPHRGYTWYSVQSPAGPSWGNTFFAETFHIGYGNEGLRGEMEGLYGVHQDNVADGEELDLSGTKFKVVQRVTNGSNAFPRQCLLMRKS